METKLVLFGCKKQRVLFDTTIVDLDTSEKFGRLLATVYAGGSHTCCTCGTKAMLSMLVREGMCESLRLVSGSTCAFWPLLFSCR